MEFSGLRLQPDAPKLTLIMDKNLQQTLQKGKDFLLILPLLFMAGLMSAQVQVTLDATNPTCGGFSNGSITANPSGGWEPYTYEWSTGATTQSIYGLGPGTYSVTVTDVDLGFNTASVTLTSPSQTDAEIVIDDICSGNGNVTVNATGGVPPYTYNWTNGANTPTLTGLDVNTQYCVTVLDANLCGVVTCTVIPAALNLTVISSDVVCAEDCDGSVTAQISGGTFPYDVLWSNGVTSTVNGNLPPGVYDVTVTDANGCVATGTGAIGAPAPVTISISSVDPSCGASDGSATATAVGGNGGPYSYSWSNGANTPTINNLEPGTYSVTATDATGCQGEAEIVISPSAQVQVGLSTSNPTCQNPNGGSITATAFNGTPPYFYQWSTGVTVATISNLDAGFYSVTVTDSEGCTAEASATLSQEGETIFASTTSEDTTCGENNGSATAEGSGGSGSYTYTWSNGASGQTIENLPAGSYTVTVTDNVSGCTAAKTVVINSSNGVSVSVNTMNATCVGNNGTAMASPSGGTAPYSYAWSNGGAGQMITGLSVGVYTVTITDALGCTATASGTVGSDDSNISISAVASSVSCFEGNDGAVTTNVTGGVAPLSYAWSSGQTSANIFGLEAGTYTVTVTDATGCTAVASATVVEPSDLVLSMSASDVNCLGTNDGTVSVSASGGTPGYTYLWSTGATTSVISGLGADVYSVTVTDANGCTASDEEEVEIGPFAELSCSLSVTNPISSAGANDGAVTAEAENGSGNYSYAWSNGASTQTISGLGAGDYSATVTDNTSGCTTVCGITLTEPGAPNGKIGDKVFLDYNGNGRFEPGDGGVGGVTVTLTGTTVNGASVNLTTVTDGAGMYLFEGLEAGNYKVTFSDLPLDFEFSPQDIGINDELDSDADPTTGMTAFFDLAQDECNLTIDAGLFENCPCDNFTDPGQICCDQTACGPGYDPAPITSLAAPSGGSGGPIEYLWMFKEGDGPFNQTQVTAIPNTNSPTYDPPVLYTTTTYYRCVRRGPCCPYIETTGVTITINDDANADFSGPADNILCQGETYTYTADVISSTATYNWTIQGIAETTDLNQPSIDVVWSSNGFYDVMLTVTDNACTASTIDNRLVTNSPDYCGTTNFGMIIDATVIHSSEVEIEMLSSQGADLSMSYAIERSKDGENFEEIGAPVMTPGDYNLFSDDDPLRGRSFYRVRITSATGGVAYSNVEEITIFIGNENTLVYPNPFNSFISYEIKDTFGEDVTAEIISPDGRILRTSTTDKDTFFSDLDTSGLATGVYFLRFRFSGLGVQTYKLLKQ